MKIAVLGINYSPELTGIGVYTTEMCEYFKSVGHKVTVFTGFPYYPQWKIFRKYKRKFFMAEDYHGVAIKRSYLYVPNKVTTKFRILQELSFIISSFFNMLFSPKPDILVTVSPPLGLGLVAYIISRIKKVPFIFHIQDLQPDAAVELGMLKNKIILELLYRIERIVYQTAKEVSVISKKMRERILFKGIKKEKIILFSNWADTEYIKPYPKDNKFREVNKLENKFVVLYSGNIGIKQGLDVILEVAHKTRDNKNIIYVIVGNGAYKKEFHRKYEKTKLKNVIFLSVQSREMLPYMLSAADVCLIPQQKSVTDIVMPSKLLGIMSSGRPVIVGANDGSELYNVIKDADCGIVIKPEISKQMLEAIIEIYNNPEKGEKYGKKGRGYVVQHFSRINILKSFDEKIRKIIHD